MGIKNGDKAAVMVPTKSGEEIKIKYNESTKHAKKNRKKLLQKEVITIKAPSASKASSKRVAKNILAQTRSMPKEEVLMERERSKQIEKVILSLASPKDFPVTRLGAEYGSMATAVANPWQRLDADFVDLGEGDLSTQAFIFRDARCSIILPRKTNSQNTTYYSDFASYPINLAPNPNPVQFRPFKYGGNGAPVHGNVFYPGKKSDGLRTYIWVTGGITSLTITTAATGVGLDLYRYNRNGVVEQVNRQNFAALPGPQAITGLTTDGYYGVDLYIAAASTGLSWNGSFLLTYNANAWIWGHLAAPYFYASEGMVNAFKQYANSIMLTNYTAPIYKQGKIAAAQIPQGRHWIDYIGYNAVASIRESYGSDAVNGYYGFLKPTQEQDFFFSENCECDKGNIVSSWFELDRKSDGLTINCDLTGVTNISMYWTHAVAIEYRTDDQWREQKKPHIGGNVVDVARKMLVNLPQHHENPLHLSDIFNYVKGVAGDVYDGFKAALPRVVDGALTIGKIAAVAAPFL